jgi:hypothetical protein
MDGPAVTIVDRVTLGANAAIGWLDRLRTEYAPGAARRGMRLAGTWWSYVGPDAVEVTVRWELPDVAAFWAMRRGAAHDDAVRAWWASTDAIAQARQRNVCAAT